MTHYGKPMSISALPAALQRQVRRQLGGYPDQARPTMHPAAPKPPRGRRGPNKTELEAFALFPYRFVFEGREFEICGGAKYTPDGVDPEHAVALEAKGEFIHSRDSRRRFDEAKHLYPAWTWIWARKRNKGRKGPRWEVEIYEKKR